ncbi:SDR family oxidoreductase [Methylobacterium oryzisoli]|uniref:SDR family oxidoreductase n=1 Tax=Methylobacterium oryzisoli TaxID=3385502 RepID=UPI003892AE00
MAENYLVTGASSGFGRLMTERLLERGDRVVATVRRPDALAELRSAYPERLHVETLEMTETDGIGTVVDRAFATMGRIDVVVSNAGYGLFGAAEELEDGEIDRQIATNLTGSIQLIRRSLSRMRGQNLDGARRGRIVQISSEGGQIAYPGFSLYHATKCGIEGFVEAVAQEVAPFGIDFLLVEPGPTGTNFLAGMRQVAPMAEYDGTPVGDVRRSFGTGQFGVMADADRSVAAMIDAMDADKPALRLALGSNAFDGIAKALAARSQALEAQKAIALGADGDR